MKEKTVNKVLLSICIPSYNRSNQVVELVKRILTCKRSDLRVIVTDDQSTDDTVDKIKDINDNRLKIVVLEEHFPAYQAMIKSIFNGEGKYILYCNDRDIINPDGLSTLMEYLEDKEFTFVYTKNGEKIRGKYIRLTNGFESIMHNDCFYHPTGLVYNGEIIHSHLNAEKYYQFNEYIYTWSFLMFDLFKYGSTAKCDCGVWSHCPKNIIKTQKSGAVQGKDIYFYPSVITKIMKRMVPYVLIEAGIEMSNEQKQKALLHVLSFCGKELLSYKYRSIDKYEVAHYGIEKRFISVLSIIKEYKKYYKETLEVISQLPESLSYVTSWKIRQPYMLVLLTIGCLYHDIRMLLRSCIKPEHI